MFLCLCITERDYFTHYFFSSFLTFKTLIIFISKEKFIFFSNNCMTLVNQKDSGAFLERRFAGLRTVEIQCSEGSFDLTNSTWGYQVLS